MTKIDHISDIGFAILAVFVLIGLVISPEKAMMMAVILTIGWALTRMIKRGFDAYITWTSNKTIRRD